MSVAVEMAVARLPLPSHFSHAEQSFSIKKRRTPLSSSSTSTSSYSPLSRLSQSVPPLPPSKGCPPLSRVFPHQPSPFTPLSQSLDKSPPTSSVYDPNKQQTYFDQCFTNLGLLGRGSFGEVFKVQSNEDGHKYAVKRSAHRFRGNTERNQSLREASYHERLCPHPHILNFVAAWEECGRLYIQTELCSASLLLHAENKPPGPDEPAAWNYLCDLLSALEHLHSRGFVHLDLKPANVLVTESGRLKLADFGLLFKFSRKNGDQTVKDEIQEGDPRYMAPELLRGEYGPAADVFSLGVSILELACNLEVPNGGEGWQQLRRGCLPAELISGLSSEFHTVLQMMLAPEPSKRPTILELLALPCVKKRIWKRRIYLTITETVLALTSLCQKAVCFGWRVLFSLPWSFVPQWSKSLPCTPPKGSWDKDLTLPLSAMMAESGTPEEEESVFFGDQIDPDLSPTFSHRLKLRSESTSTPLSGSPSNYRRSSTHSPNCSVLRELPSWDVPLRLSRINSFGSCHDLTPNGSPIHTSKLIRQSSKSTEQSGRNWVRADETRPRPNFEPKNLLSLFEETTTLDGQP
ncbi:membrane-associated tyrosine- and threonine-specific cdc2-inhibitory kinase [Eucyclogobius newberryi]|uniref:membrane-associated tyrosine- and threonine-specific cdc2-inhibitory kinase n=1 Tax=Eucyclogobius newberryi TaxID=166745 RepID=UPI003B5BF2C4